MNMTVVCKSSGNSSSTTLVPEIFLSSSASPLLVATSRLNFVREENKKKLSDKGSQPQNQETSLYNLAIGQISNTLRRFE